MSNAIRYVLLDRPRRSRRREQEVRRVHAHVPAEAHATRTVSIVVAAMSCSPERPSYTRETIRISILNVSHRTAEMLFAKENQCLNVRIWSCPDGEAHLDRAAVVYSSWSCTRNYEDDGSEQMQFGLCIFIRIRRALFLTKFSEFQE